MPNRSTATDLRMWYGPDVPIHKVRIMREMDGTEIGLRNAPTIRYAKGTHALAVLSDPERPGMADVQLPNGKLVRCMLSDVQVLDEGDR